MLFAERKIQLFMLFGSEQAMVSGVLTPKSILLTALPLLLAVAQ